MGFRPAPITAAVRKIAIRLICALVESSVIAGVATHGAIRMISARMLIKIAISGCGIKRLKCAFIFFFYDKVLANFNFEEGVCGCEASPNCKTELRIVTPALSLIR